LTGLSITSGRIHLRRASRGQAPQRWKRSGRIAGVFSPWTVLIFSRLAAVPRTVVFRPRRRARRR